jgi:hypothetical protein
LNEIAPPRQLRRWVASIDMEKNELLRNPLLHRYWFEVKGAWGYGVTAYSEEDARNLILAAEGKEWDRNLIRVIVDIDVRNLDQGHVIPNMGPPNLRGVWFPMLNVLPAFH